MAAQLPFRTFHSVLISFAYLRVLCGESVFKVKRKSVPPLTIG